MLPRKKLIPLKAEFDRIRTGGKMYDSPSFGIVVSFRPQDEEKKGQLGPQCAFIVSKKIDRKSVVRHEVKRKFSDAVSPFLDRLPKNLELVFLAKKNGTSSSREEIKLEVENVLKRAHLLK